MLVQYRVASGAEAPPPIKLEKWPQLVYTNKQVRVYETGLFSWLVRMRLQKKKRGHLLQSTCLAFFFLFSRPRGYSRIFRATLALPTLLLRSLSLFACFGLLHVLGVTKDWRYDAQTGGYFSEKTRGLADVLS